LQFLIFAELERQTKPFKYSNILTSFQPQRLATCCSLTTSFSPSFLIMCYHLVQLGVLYNLFQRTPSAGLLLTSHR